MISRLCKAGYLLDGVPNPGWSTMNKPLLILVLGVLLALVSLLADTLGFGSAGTGWKQIAGTVVGVVVAIIGGVMLSRGSAGGQSA